MEPTDRLVAGQALKTQAPITAARLYNHITVRAANLWHTVT